jgi:hypothetical protein
MEHQDTTTFQVYYRSWPHKNLRQVTARCVTASDALSQVAEMLKDEQELHYKPLMAMIVGGAS